MVRYRVDTLSMLIKEVVVGQIFLDVGHNQYSLLYLDKYLQQDQIQLILLVMLNLMGTFLAWRSWMFRLFQMSGLLTPGEKVQAQIYAEWDHILPCFAQTEKEKGKRSLVFFISRNYRELQNLEITLKKKRRKQAKNTFTFQHPINRYFKILKIKINSKFYS